MAKVVFIGRNNIFGNPYIPKRGQELKGTTLEDYKRYLWAAMNQKKWATALYKDITGIDLPDDFSIKIRELKGSKLYCPGCKERSCEEGVCHGSILIKAIEFLNNKNE